MIADVLPFVLPFLDLPDARAATQAFASREWFLDCPAWLKVQQRSRSRRATTTPLHRFVRELTLLNPNLAVLDELLGSFPSVAKLTLHFTPTAVLCTAPTPPVSLSTAMRPLRELVLIDDSCNGRHAAAALAALRGMEALRVMDLRRTQLPLTLFPATSWPPPLRCLPAEASSTVACLFPCHRCRVQREQEPEQLEMESMEDASQDEDMV